MKRWLYPDGVNVQWSIGLLFLRLVMGVAFLLHGWPKIHTPFGWMPPDAPIPGVMQMLAAVAEFGGGIALVLGLLTRPAAIGLAATMTVAAAFHISAGDPFVSPGGKSYELAAVYLVCSVLFLLTGPGRLSFDALIFGRPNDSRRI